jgi:predicted membrane channel-forming protein YqfA (hemolysin III family)
VNIWSHLLGACLFLALLLYSYLQFLPRYDNSTFADGLALAIFFSGVTICFVPSTMYNAPI